MEIEQAIRNYKDRLRIFLILYYFGEGYYNPQLPQFSKVFKSEVRIQKIDFLLRNPDYLSYELLRKAEGNSALRPEIMAIVRRISEDEEPEIRRLEMERFFFGAYEDIDDVISFLHSRDFIHFQSKRGSDLKTVEKQYFITQYADQKVSSSLGHLAALRWYMDRCLLIKKYFGDLNGTQLKVSQYQIEEYKNTSYGQFINSIQATVKEIFHNLYGEQL